MHEAPVSKVHGDVRHLPIDAEKQKVAGAQLVLVDCSRRRPKLACRAGNRNTGTGVGKLDKAAAVEPLGCRATVAIRNANLVEGDHGSALALASGLRRGSSRRI